MPMCVVLYTLTCNHCVYDMDQTMKGVNTMQRTQYSYNRPHNAYGRTGASTPWIAMFILIVILFFGNGIVEGILHMLGL